MDKPKSIWQQTSNISSKMAIQNQNENQDGINQQKSQKHPFKQNNLEITAQQEQINLKNIGKIELQRTLDDDEFSQILKSGKQNKIDFKLDRKQFFKSSDWNLKENSSIGLQQKSISNKNTLNITEENPYLSVRYFNFNKNTDEQFNAKTFIESNKLLQNQDEIKLISEKKQIVNRDIDSFFGTAPHFGQLNQILDKGQIGFNKSLKSTGKKTDYSAIQFSSKFNTAEKYSPEFGHTELSFQNKKNNDKLRRNIAQQDFDINKLTLEQFSTYQFSRNPFLSKDQIKFEQSSLIKKAIQIEKCQNYTFLCEPCFELANNLSQDSNQSFQNEYTIKSKSKYINQQYLESNILDFQTTEKKQVSKEKQNETEEEINYFLSIESHRPKLSCFCKNGMIGEEQFYKKLEEVHMSKIIQKKDVTNYFRFLIWRLSYKQKLSIESLYYHLEKRIFMKQKLSFQPFIEKYLSFLETHLKQKQANQIAANNKKQQNQNNIQDNSQINLKQLCNYPNQIILIVGQIFETSQQFIVEFTDTWSSLYLVINKSMNVEQLLSISRNLNQNIQAQKKGNEQKRNILKMSNQQLFEDLISRKKIKPQTKVRISNISLANQQKIKIQIDSGEIKEFTNLIQIPFNSFQKENNKHAKLGYLNKPFLRSLSSIKPNGEFISTLDLVILKRYPLLVQYHSKEQKKIINFSEAVSSSVIDKANSNDFFYAKYLVCDSLFIYDQSYAISSQPETEIIIQFNDLNQYSEINEGSRIRIRNTLCSNYDVQNHYLSGYKITLKSDYKNVMLQESFMTKQDYQRTKSFYQSVVKAFAKSKSIEDYSSCCNLNYLEILDFDIQISFRSYSQNNNSIIGEINYLNQSCECEIITHNSFFKTKLLRFEKYQILRLFNVHFKCFETSKKKFIFKTSYNTYIQL